MGIRDPPKPIEYTERDGKTKFTGMVVNEERIVEQYKWGDFCKVLQEIKKDGDKITDYLRLGYYVKDHRAPYTKYRWGSQTGQIIQKKNFSKLIRKAKRRGIL